MRKLESSKGLKINPKNYTNLNFLKSSISLFEINKTKTKNNISVLPPQLTPQRLGHFFGESNSCWVLEDFHKITGENKTKIAQLMKVFMDMSVNYDELKIIAIGAVSTARQVVEYDSELSGRVSEIKVPIMDNDEIEEIINKGEKLLNIHFSIETKEKIIKYSCGSPTICHQICLNICFNVLYKSLGADGIKTGYLALEKYSYAPSSEKVEKSITQRRSKYGAKRPKK